MKKLKFFGCFAIGTMSIASFLLANNSAQKSESNLAMSNVEALHASAGGEMFCDQSNEQECKITMGDATGYSTGVLKATWD